MVVIPCLVMVGVPCGMFTREVVLEEVEGKRAGSN